MKRAIALATVAVAGAAAAPAVGHHDSTLPDALERPKRVKQLYPDLVQRALPKWPQIFKMARTRWMAEHRCDPRTITRRFALNPLISWSLVELRWECRRVAQGTRSFLRCIADHEGGRYYPDVWYGGSRGWQGGRFTGSDRVVNHFQTRPYWASLAHPDVGDYLVTWRTFSILTNPVHAADVAIRVGRGAYATMGMCS